VQIAVALGEEDDTAVDKKPNKKKMDREAQNA
jgi:hypothetical protein